MISCRRCTVGWADEAFRGIDLGDGRRNRPAARLLEGFAERPTASIQGRVNSLAVHPNGRWLFSAGLDGVIRRWDMSHLPAKPKCDLAMEALPNDNWVVWADPDGPERRWLLDRSSPDAKRWLGWHAPIKGADRWAHHPMEAYPTPP